MDILLSKVWKYPLTGLKENPPRKLLIDTLNVHCFNTAQNDPVYTKALLESDVLLPDGIGIVIALNFLYDTKLKKIAGYDLFIFELNRLNSSKGKCFFLGSSEKVLNLIKRRIQKEYPDIKAGYYSPPFKDHFSDADNQAMITAVNASSPDVLFVGMTAPKQEKWAAEHFNYLNVGHLCCIGAVFDFYATTVNRSPQWMIKAWLEWFYRLIKEPRRLWPRYIIGNTKFIFWVIKKKIFNSNTTQDTGQMPDIQS